LQTQRGLHHLLPLFYLHNGSSLVAPSLIILAEGKPLGGQAATALCLDFICVHELLTTSILELHSILQGIEYSRTIPSTMHLSAILTALLFSATICHAQAVNALPCVTHTT
jgi:hypothetical protein